MTTPGAAFDRVLQALDQAGKRYKHDRTNHVQASCAGPRHQHGDRNPSLSITAIEGQVLLHCHSGCDRGEVLDALGLTDADLFDDKRGTGYIYDDGRKVWRSPDKQFRQSGNTNGQNSTLYRLRRVQEAVDHGQLVFLVEGEKDVHSLEAIGEIATTAPMGASNIDKCDLTPLHGGQVIAIVDRDESGESWARYLRIALANKADLEFTQARSGKDISDHIAAGLGVGELQPYAFPISQLLAGARTADWLGQQTFDPITWVVPEVIPEGYGLLVGAPKIGKSWLALSIALAASSGGYMFGKIYCGRPRPVLLLALEDSDRRIQSRIRKLQPEDPSWPSRLTYFTHVEPGQVIALIEEWLIEIPYHDRPLVVLDTVGKIIPPAFPGESQYSRDYRFSSRLQSITQQRPGMALIGLHHDRKANTDDFVESISGTNGIAGAADTLLVIARPRNEAEGLLKVTGRDVDENEFGIKLIEGNWTLLGENLREAARSARTVHATVGLSENSAEIIEFLSDHADQMFDAAAISEAVDMIPKDVSTYCDRLWKAGRIRKPKRGKFASRDYVDSVEGVETTTSPNSTKSTESTDQYARTRTRAREEGELPIEEEE